MKDSFALPSNKLVYIYKLIVTTPYYGWVVLLQIISGFATFAGLPLLVPVLDYLREDKLEAGSKYLVYFDKLFSFIGVEPSFYSVLALASSLIIVGQILLFISYIVARFIQLNINRNYQNDLFASYVEVNWMWSIKDKSGEMNYAVSREAEMAAIAHFRSIELIIYSVQFATFLTLALIMSFPTTLLACIVYVILFIINHANTKKVYSLSEKNNNSLKVLSSLTMNFLQNRKFFMSTMAYGNFMKKIGHYIDESVKYAKLSNLREQLQTSWTMVLTFVFLVFVIAFHKNLNMGFSEVLLIFILLQKISPQFQSLFSAYLSLNKLLPVHKSFFQRLDGIKNNKEENGDKCFEFNKPVVFKDLCFNYPGRKGVIDNLNLKINPYQTAAFVGGSGEGKSTILDLILGLLKPDSGNIFYGDIPHHQLDLRAFRKGIAYVSQETTLLDGTLRENLTIGCIEEVSDKRLEEICKKVNIDKFISELPEGLQTEIGENGVKLSGGQKQRVALGRALMTEPKILILDEATSQLDSETEKFIQQAIKVLHKKLTIIIVAHRLSTVRFSDTVHVLEKGKIIEQGTFEELLAQKGRLYELDVLQGHGNNL
jgi:ABC-type multidrug transport system fused ATPase/permease subunit